MRQRPAWPGAHAPPGGWGGQDYNTALCCSGCLAAGVVAFFTHCLPATACLQKRLPTPTILLKHVPSAPNLFCCSPPVVGGGGCLCWHLHCTNICCLPACLLPSVRFSILPAFICCSDAHRHMIHRHVPGTDRNRTVACELSHCFQRQHALPAAHLFGTACLIHDGILHTYKLCISFKTALLLIGFGFCFG